ncbi:hypothetical protein VTN96DRAFT_8925 [Rasamsonia emersonii]|uniref:Cyclin-D1-binding protein 1-like N-terminal domain-containing protein n=1 Tax=Rasamsonia emersonii (strain ATCC 16479 / CBS 393.64 / IMI 116815) TaxID=1408163 RepID=A0A0F4YVA2_RASE3|nr:hypothetical protein T310_3930 [Rasamsonia emersonii CBS 393.64]KKA22040.1 hypothetical protein T310_3930 [Rasamsonia emersonii CBS 393.64]
MAEKLSRLLETTLALSGQFEAALSASPAKAAENDTNKSSSDSNSQPPEPLQLLSKSSTLLRSQVTKLSLLAINTPFTPSALSTVLMAVNDSVLPSLVTAALLVTPDEHTKAFTAEVRVLTKTVLKEFSSLVEEVRKIAKKNDEQQQDKKKKDEELPQSEKDSVTTATGRVWDACDTLTQLVGKGVVGFVVRRVEQWRDLVKDAIDELAEWDPDEDDEDDDLLLDDDEENEPVKGAAEDEDQDQDRDDNETTTAALHAHKKTALRAFKPIGQIYPAIISNRLKKGGLTASDTTLPPRAHIAKLESLVSDLQAIPGYVDEAAGSLYESNIANSVLYLKKARDCAEHAIRLVTFPWAVEGKQPEEAEAVEQEDKFTAWSRTWLKVMDEVMSEVDRK